MAATPERARLAAVPAPAVPLSSDTPRHVAIIMDGNGRWAQQRGLARSKGHEAGDRNVRPIVQAASDLGVGMLTQCVFSTENWKRPRQEVVALMALLRRATVSDPAELRGQGVRLRVLGRTSGLPNDLSRLLDNLQRDEPSNTQLTLNLAINYGGRAEIVDAAKRLATLSQAGEMDWREIGERLLARQLHCPETSDVDLIIRTGGEQRLSNFSLWQAAQAAFWCTPAYWPEFRRQHLEYAIKAWQENTLT